MSEGAARLSEREREVLGLLLRGHGAKSAARELGLSVHTVNEHLREARRKLGVTSSREAARLLARESDDPNFLGDNGIGVAEASGPAVDRGRSDRRAADGGRPSFLQVMGAVLMLLLAAALGAWAMNDRAPSVQPAAGAPPRVVSTSPATGALISPGPFVLSVTFDQPMMDRNYSFVQKSPDTFPQCVMPPALSKDARTYAVRCTAVAGRSYEVWFNSPPYMAFKGLNGMTAQPHQLLFRVRSR